MINMCKYHGKRFAGMVLTLFALPVYAQDVTFNLLIQPNTIPDLTSELKVNCSGKISLDLTNVGGLIFETDSDNCPNPVDESVSFDNLSQVDDLPVKVMYTDLQNSENPLSFSAKITSGEGPFGDNQSTFNIVISPAVTATPTDNSNDSNQDDTPDQTDPDNQDIGDILVQENACDFAKQNDPGSGVYEPGDNCPDGAELTIYDGSNGNDTEVPGCINQPSALPSTCRGGTVFGHNIFSQRLDWVDVGKSRELVGFIQATTINTMIGEDLSAYKNVIIAVSETPGEFNTTLNCKDITASENSTVYVIQSDSNLAEKRPGKYCELTPGKRYYINVRFDGGNTNRCGIDQTCQYTVVERLPDAS